MNPHYKMNPFAPITSVLPRLFPSVELTVTPPKLKEGVWSLDIDHDKTKLAVDWDPSRGFGVSSVRADSYGESPDEFYPGATATLVRLIMLLTSQQHTTPQTARMGWRS